MDSICYLFDSVVQNLLILWLNGAGLSSKIDILFAWEYVDIDHQSTIITYLTGSQKLI